MSLATTPLLSVIMPVYNMEPYVGLSIASLINQSYTNWELLVMDDGSNDGTLSIIDKIADSRIRVFRSQQQAGIAERLNQALQYCRGEYIVRMDADDICLPRRLEKQIAFLLSHPQVDLVGTSILFIDDHNQPIGKVICPTEHEALCGNLSKGFPLFHSTWMARSGWLRVYGYRKMISNYGGEDADLLFRSYQTSRFACLKEPLLAYRYPYSARKRLINAGWIVLLLGRHRLWKQLGSSVLTMVPKSVALATISVFSKRLFNYMLKAAAPDVTPEHEEFASTMQSVHTILACQSHQKP